jgi:hypothetical protein
VWQETNLALFETIHFDWHELDVRNCQLVYPIDTYLVHVHRTQFVSRLIYLFCIRFQFTNQARTPKLSILLANFKAVLSWKQISKKYKHVVFIATWWLSFTKQTNKLYQIKKKEFVDESGNFDNFHKEMMKYIYWSIEETFKLSFNYFFIFHRTNINNVNKQKCSLSLFIHIWHVIS